MAKLWKKLLGGAALAGMLCGGTVLYGKTEKTNDSAKILETPTDAELPDFCNYDCNRVSCILKKNRLNCVKFCKDNYLDNIVKCAPKEVKEEKKKKEEMKKKEAELKKKKEEEKVAATKASGEALEAAIAKEKAWKRNQLPLDECKRTCTADRCLVEYTKNVCMDRCQDNYKGLAKCVTAEEMKQLKNAKQERDKAKKVVKK